jgi:hypothetical protein
VNNSITIVPASQGLAPSSELVLHGGGNALLLQVGALHRLYEVGFLNELSITTRSESFFTPEECRMIDDWNTCARSILTRSENLVHIFESSVRRLRRKRSLLIRRSAQVIRSIRTNECRATLCRVSKPTLSWGVTDTLAASDNSLNCSNERRDELVKLLKSSDRLPELMLDYLIDWGYLLCDATLASEGIFDSPKQIAFASPNRLFYKHITEARAVSLTTETPRPNVDAEAAKDHAADEAA